MEQHHQRGHILKCDDTQIVKNTRNLDKQEKFALQPALMRSKTELIVKQQIQKFMENGTYCTPYI